MDQSFTCSSSSIFCKQRELFKARIGCSTKECHAKLGSVIGCLIINQDKLSNMDAEIEQEVNSGLANALKVPIYAAKKQHYEILKSIIEGVDVLCNSATYLKYIPDEPNVFNVYEEVSKEYASLGHQVAVYKAQVEKIEMLLEQGTLVRD